MVKFNLCIRALLTNLNHLQPYDGCDSPSFPYYLKLRCTACQEVTSKYACVTLQDSDFHQNKEVSLKIQCKVCEKTGTITLIQGHGRPLSSADSEKGIAAPVMQLDCDGLEPDNCALSTGWRAFTTFDGGAVVDVDLSSGSFELLGPSGDARAWVEGAVCEFEQVVVRKRERVKKVVDLKKGSDGRGGTAGKKTLKKK